MRAFKGRLSGQVLVGVLALLLVLMIIVPAMVKYIQGEASWSTKQARNTDAFQLAEAAVDRGYQKVTESTTTWQSVQNGTQQLGFHFDRDYTELPQGDYTISITSGPGTQVVTIIGIGRDAMHKEVRALQVIYANAAMSNISIMGVNGVDMSGKNVEVEWGSVVSQKTITIGSKLHPSFYSAASIDLDSNGATPPNCDGPNCWWWHSYYGNTPPTPNVDFAAYKSSAQASGNDSCGNAYYQSGNYSGSCDDTQGKTYYIEGNWTSFKSGIVGNVIVLGNMSWTAGKQDTVGAYNATMPAYAWKQYCNDWSVYQAWDPAAVAQPACFGSLNNSYAASGVTVNISPAIHGFVYVGGTLSIPNGGGSSDLVHGVILVQGSADINTNSKAHIYYDNSIAMNTFTTKILLTRTSWQDLPGSWPSGL